MKRDRGMERRNGARGKNKHIITASSKQLQGRMTQRERWYTQVCYLGLLQVVHNSLHEGGVVPTCDIDGCRLVSVCPKQASYFVFQITGVSWGETSTFQYSTYYSYKHNSMVQMLNHVLLASYPGHSHEALVWGYITLWQVLQLTPRLHVLFSCSDSPSTHPEMCFTCT